jgi:hypothetical protein
MLLHDALFYQVLAGVLTAAAALLGLWSYQTQGVRRAAVSPNRRRHFHIVRPAA